MFRFPLRFPTLIAALIAVAPLAACSSSAKEDAGGAKRGPTQVGYVVVQPTAVPRQTQLGGRTAAYESSEVRPQVNGLIRRKLFTEGSFVRQGQPLFQIDPSLYAAAVDQAAANVSAARATASAAQVRASRYRPLAQMQAISQQDYTDAAAQARQAAAQVEQNAAALRTARINLNFTTVRAPISGRIGRSLFTVGALVTANQADPLAAIQRTDPMYVDIQQASADLQALRQSLATGGVLPGSTQVRIVLEDNTAYPFTGTIQFSEAVVNESTGTVTVRAAVPNPQGQLLPGMFVQAQFTEAVDPRAFLVPQAAVQRDIGGEPFLFVVGPGNKAERRRIVADRTFGPNWVVTGGLMPGDKVITQGTANLKDKAPVRPVPASAPQRLVPGKAGQGKGRGGAGGGGNRGGGG